VEVQTENEYEDLLSLWSDLESGIGIILASPASIQEFELRVWQYDRWMQALLQRDTDVGLYLLFQLATNSPVGYSASHALVCAVLCHLMAAELKVSTPERNSLVHAALTMNIAMTAMQDDLASQVEKPSSVQTDMIRAHTTKGALMLVNLKVSDDLWLDVVTRHHDERTDGGAFRTIPPATRLARILRIVDRYAAMISPRKSRTGRSTAESLRSLISSTKEQVDDVGQALVRVVGMYPPGTYVRLESAAVAVVMRRTAHSSAPHVAIVVDEDGQPIARPQLHRTAVSGSKIASALAASALNLRINHHLILQMGAHASQH
jgi:HD-GYP domain-containing protein (c-di-GMP phosphodiesterase class II)